MTDLCTDPSGLHATIPIRIWFRRRHVCVRCHRVFTVEAR